MKIVDIQTLYPELVAAVANLAPEKPGQWMARCPAHDDQRNSLAIAIGDDGRLLLSCFAGCDAQLILAELGLPTRYLFQGCEQHRLPASAQRQFIEHYLYRDEHGHVLFRVSRTASKEFPQSRPDGHGEWIWKGVSKLHCLYRLPELKHADPSEPVLICEGEKDVHTAIAGGFVATTAPGGAGAKWRPEYSAALAGRDVVLLPDNDEPGRQLMERAAQSLHAAARSVRVLHLCEHIPSLPAKGDLSDAVALGFQLVQLRTLIATTAVWAPAPETLAAAGTTPIRTRAQVDTTAYDPRTTDPRRNEGRTDSANARRFIEMFGDRVRYCHAWQTWLVWDSRRWKRDSTGELYRLGMNVHLEILKQAVNIPDSEERKSVINFALGLGSKRAIEAMLSFARALAPIQPEELDVDPWLFNCQNGTLDLRTGTLSPHDPQHKLSKIAPVRFDPEASSYAFDRFLESIFPTQDLIDFAQRFFGYCLTGNVSEQLLAIFHGTGSNGKSTLLNAILDVMGNDYAMSATVDLLLENKADSHPTQRADLFGKRLVVCTESESTGRLAEATVKQLTGGDKVRARHLFRDYFEFHPSHKIVLATNHRPGVHGNEHAIWRRLRLVPFEQRFWNPDNGESGPAELRMDKQLATSLQGESAGILAWAVRGCLAWQQSGLGNAKAVLDATSEYRSQTDIIGRFVAERCRTDPTLSVPFAEFYGAYEAWCDQSGEPLISKRNVGNWLQQNCYERKRSNGIRIQGLTLAE